MLLEIYYYYDQGNSYYEVRKKFILAGKEISEDELNDYLTDDIKKLFNIAPERFRLKSGKYFSDELKDTCDSVHWYWIVRTLEEIEKFFKEHGILSIQLMLESQLLYIMVNLNEKNIVFNDRYKEICKNCVYFDNTRMKYTGFDGEYSFIYYCKIRKTKDDFSGMVEDLRVYPTTPACICFKNKYMK